MKFVHKYRLLLNNIFAMLLYGISDILLNMNIPMWLRFFPFMIGTVALYIFMVNIATFGISKLNFDVEKPEVIGHISIGVGILAAVAMLSQHLIGTGAF